MNTTQYQPNSDVLNADYLHSAFLIDKEGNEIRITRDMILACCNTLASNEATTNLTSGTPLKPENP